MKAVGGCLTVEPVSKQDGIRLEQGDRQKGGGIPPIRTVTPVVRTSVCEAAKAA